MSYLFTSESVSEGHPDKVADQISDAILDKMIAFDPKSKVACETLVTTGQVVIAGEVKTETYIDVQETAREVINRIGYTKAEYRFDGDSCGVFSSIHEQSPDISMGVEREEPESQGAGDQGMMFGYATNETENYMPVSLELSHKLLMVLAEIRRENKVMTYLRPDAKSQVTIEYGDDNKPVRIHTIVISTQHDDFGPTDAAMLAKIRQDVVEVLIPRVISSIGGQMRSMLEEFLANLDRRPQTADGRSPLSAVRGPSILHVNPTGKFVIGGPHGDSGLTGRKIIVDTYGGKGAHGGGAFSGKDPSKVDRSAAYAARHIAKNLVAAGVSDEILVQLSYAIGVADPINIFVNTYGKSHVKISDSEIAEKIGTYYNFRPKAIERRLKLRNPIYSETAAYGHMGRVPQIVKKTIKSSSHGTQEFEVELFTWEKLDLVEGLKKLFQ
jgi:S-adenosylmethionine synthetase